DAVSAPAGREADVSLTTERTAYDDRRPGALVVARFALGCERRRGIADPDDLRLRPLFPLSPSPCAELRACQAPALRESLEERELRRPRGAVPVLREMPLCQALLVSLRVVVLVAVDEEDEV